MKGYREVYIHVTLSVLMLLSSHTAALCCTCTQLRVVVETPTHPCRERETNRHTLAHKELCATGGVGVIVSYR